MREAVEKNPNMSEKEARDLIDKCMKILHYRDGRSFNRVSTSDDKDRKTETPVYLT